MPANSRWDLIQAFKGQHRESMLVFPELGKGLISPHCLQTTLNVMVSASLCADVKWRHVIIRVTTCSDIAGSLKHCHFSVPLAAQGDWIDLHHTTRMLGKLCEKGLVVEGT